jgi:hypothetical protein
VLVQQKTDATIPLDLASHSPSSLSPWCAGDRLGRADALRPCQRCIHLRRHHLDHGHVLRVLKGGVMTLGKHPHHRGGSATGQGSGPPVSQSPPSKVSTAIKSIQNNLYVRSSMIVGGQRQA